jgi:GntR family transcriptional repressor for pyruvate dehydrogenase complex
VSANDTRRQGASQQAADDIRAHIKQKNLVPGDRLGREEDLARQFGVSRPTLREALRLLSSARLVRASKGPGGGIFVAATAEEGIGHMVSESVASMLADDAIGLDELLETRMVVEVPLAGLAAERATDDDIRELRALVERGHAAVEADHGVRLIDREVHRAIMKAARNRLAAAFMVWVVDVLHPSLETRIENAIVRATVVEHHVNILAALERHDPPAAERAVREHLLYLRDVLNLVDDLESAVQPAQVR